MMIPSCLSIDPATRHVSLNGRDPAFYTNPNPVYAALHAHCPTFYWEEQKQWYFIGYDHVNGLLRDRRFGRQILHIASREELGMAEPLPHLKNFDLAELHSLLELEPPEHTRLRTLVNRAFVSRHVDKMKPELAELANGLIDRFEKKGEVELLSAFADIIPVTMIARMIGIPEEMGPQLLKWSHAYVRMYMFGRTPEDE
jgi:unspecific monooxygenase